jgi:polysaccharide export outer membrane protein
MKMNIILCVSIFCGNLGNVAFADPSVQSPGLILAATAPQGTSSSGTRPGGEGAEKSSLTVTPDYIMGPEDVLEITVWKNADLSKQVQVRPDGRISLPLIGDVSAVGRTAAQLTEEISARLKSYMENPTVSILVREVNSYQIYVEE